MCCFLGALSQQTHIWGHGLGEKTRKGERDAMRLLPKSGSCLWSSLSPRAAPGLQQNASVASETRQSLELESYCIMVNSWYMGDRSWGTADRTPHLEYNN